MANRVLLGDRSAGGYGLYVSKSGTNVIDTTSANLTFSSSIVDTLGDVTSKNGQCFMVVQQGVSSAFPTPADPTETERNIYFPAIKNSDNNYTPPFCLVAWDYPSGDQSEPHIGVHYDNDIDGNYVLWGGLLEIYPWGYTSSGNGWSSGAGPMYGRMYTQCHPQAVFYYAIFHMAMEVTT